MQFDTLTIYDGDNNQGTKLSTLTGTFSNSTFTYGNKTFIEFKSDGSGAKVLPK